MEDEDYRVMLDKIFAAQKIAVQLTLKNDFYMEIPQEKVKDNIEYEVDMCKKQMEEINHMNWQFTSAQLNGNETSINDFDCMKINQRLRKVQQNKATSKLMELPSPNLILNLYSCVVTTDKMEL